ncbi:MAG: rhomboid family intramembrane serine protease [Planctomycetota bacterium]
MLPIATSIKPKRTPYMNYFLIAANVIIFLLSMQLAVDPRTRQYFFAMRPWAQTFILQSNYPSTWQFVTYAFLHGGTGLISHGLMHIIGNMFFLYLFGNNVNDKLGHIGYLCFYLAGAVFSAIGYTLISSNPILGASGAVAAVTGAYLVLFPNTLVTVVYWLFFIGTVEIRALWFIVLKLIFWDNVLAADPRHGIAYNAHLAGYGFGIITLLGLLAMGLIESNYNDLWAMLRQWNRRRKFRDAVSDGYDPYQGRPARKTVSARVESVPEASDQQKAIMDFRSRISGAMRNRNAAQAAKLYRELLELDPSQILPRQLQLDIANQLMSEGHWQPSADAYQKFLSLYGNYEYAEQVHLMLGLLCSRYLDRPREAIDHLRKAREHLTDTGQKAMCQQEIDRLNAENI